MRLAWFCVLSIVWSACASTAPVSGDVDETTLGLGTDDDSQQAAEIPVVTCFDASHGISVAVEASRPAEAGEPQSEALPTLPDQPGDTSESCGSDAPKAGRHSVPAVPGKPAQAPVLVVVERERGAVACGCGFGSVAGVAGVPAGPAALPGVPGVPAGGGTNASGEAHVAAGAPGAAGVTIMISGGAHGEPAKIVPPPSCAALIEQCYADDNDTELCEQLADCCANTALKG